MQSPKSTAEIISNSKFFFGGKEILIQHKKGVVGQNYYEDFGIKHFHKIASNPLCKSVLNAGVGKGLYLIAAMTLQNIKQGTGIDINPLAIQLTKNNLISNNITKSVILNVGDVKKYFKKKFVVDLIAFDLPHIPLPSDSDLSEELKRIIDGGPDGREYIDFMIKNSPKHLKKKGRIFFVEPDFSGSRTFKLMKENGLIPKILARKKKHLSETITTKSKREYLMSLGYRFKSDSKGEYFMMRAIYGVKK